MTSIHLLETLRRHLRRDLPSRSLSILEALTLSDKTPSVKKKKHFLTHMSLINLWNTLWNTRSLWCIRQRERGWWKEINEGCYDSRSFIWSSS